MEDGVQSGDGLVIQDQILVSYGMREETVIVPEGVHTIGEDALKACVSLKKIVLPKSLRYIKPRAFKGCRNLREVKIPEGVSYIGDYAFHRCHSLEEIQLPVSVKELGNCVFLYCDRLKEAHIPGVRRLGRQVFLNDTMLERLVISKELEEECIRDVFTSCGRLLDIAFAGGERYFFSGLVDVAIGEVLLPSLIQRIAADVLSMFELDGHCLVRFLTNLKHVEIPEGIEEIGKSCFFDRKGIQSVSLPASLKEIKSRAFRNCINLEEVSFGGTKVKVDSDAFCNCTSLKNLFLPGGRKFRMQGISGFVEEKEENKDAAEDGGDLDSGVPELVHLVKKQILGNFRLCGSVLLKYLGNESRVAVPNGVTVIAEEAFAGKEEIDRILLPDGVQKIGAGAFRGCLLLQTIAIPDSVKSIGAGAFENCVKLLRITLPDALVKIEGMTFRNCRKLKEINFGAGLREIGEQAFYGCSFLTEPKFPQTLSNIGTMAFYRCGKLGKIELGAGLKEMGNLAFAQSGVREVHVFCGCEEFGSSLFAGCTGLASLYLHQGVCHIPDKMASGCFSLSNVKLPGTLCSVGRDTMEKTPFLQGVKEGLESCPKILWDDSEFSGEAVIPKYIEIIAGGAFYGNKHITSISMHGGITWVGSAAFKGCRALKKAVWPAGLKNLQPEVFSGCDTLSEIQNASAWQRVGERAFYKCKNLENTYLSELEYIGKEAFFGCLKLKKEPLKKVAWIGEAAFSDTLFVASQKEECCGEQLTLPAVRVGDIAVGVPDRCMFGGILDGTTGIAPYAFCGDTSIKKLHLPESVQFVGEGAFSGCSQLEEIIFPSGNCQIGERAFEKCTSLKSIRLCSDRVGERAFAWCTGLFKVFLCGSALLNKSAFEGCGNLREVLFDGNLADVEIGSSCFCGCGKLSRIDLNRAKKIGRYAFNNCDSLEQITLSCDTVVKPYAFADCGRLAEIEIFGGRAELLLKEYALSGCTALRRVRYLCQSSSCEWELQVYQDIFSERIPESVRMIFYSAFSCFEVEDEEFLCGYNGGGRIVGIPSGIRKIKAEVFRDRTVLEEVFIPESVEYIGARAFHGTAWLAKQREISGAVIINHMLLDGSACTGRVEVSSDIRLVCGWAFANGMGIKEICFASSSVKVEEFAFRNCIYLEKIELPGCEIRLFGLADRQRELPPLAKQIVMERLNCFKTDGDNVLLECTGNITELLVAYGIRRIGENVFRESNLMTKIILPPSVTSIGRGAFAGCKWLRYVCQQVAGTYQEAGGGSIGIGCIEDMAFSCCGQLLHIDLTDSLKSIGKRAFEHCTSLEEIYLPEGIEEIPERAFFRCHSLKKVKFPSTLKRIGKEAFAFCGQLDISGLADNVEVLERAFVR